MKDPVVKRSTFLKIGAGLGVSAGLGVMAQKSLANEGQFKENWEPKLGQADTIETVNITASLCNGCPNQCGMRLFSDKGAFWKVLGHPNHPYSHGHLCTRGYGFPRAAYAPTRISTPLKRVEGHLVECSWDEAYDLIAKAVEKQRIQDASGIFMIQDARASKQLYGKRFIKALGSPNYVTDAANSNLGLLASSLSVIGTALNPDIKNSKYIVLLGKSYGETFRPHEPLELVEARAQGAKVVFVDPRLDDTSSQVDLWVPVKAGTELAFLLGVCHWLVHNKRYDTQFVKTYGVGFDEFVQALAPYDLQTTAAICAVDPALIEEVARGLADNAPQALVENTWNGIYGAAYANTADTVRTVILLNALLGNFNKQGGQCIISDLQIPEEAGKVTALAQPQDRYYGFNQSRLASFLGASAAQLFEALQQNKVGVLFIEGTNLVRDFISSEKAAELLGNAEFRVAIATHHDETTALCNVVLPQTTYLERKDAIQSFNGFKQGVALRRPAVDKIHENTRDFSEIYSQLAEHCGVGDAFNFTLDEFNQARLEATEGLANKSYEELLNTGIMVQSVKPYAELRPFYTPSQKIEFSSQAFKAAGLDSVPRFKAEEALSYGVMPLSYKQPLQARAAELSKKIADENWAKIYSQTPPSAGMQQSLEDYEASGAVSPYADKPLGALGQVPAAAYGKVALKAEPASTKFRLITGEQCMHNHSSSTHDSCLMNISKDYKLDSLWLHQQVADDLGIATGDMVELVSELATTQAQAYVCSSIEPSSVYLPLHYGATDLSKEDPSQGFGSDASVHRPFVWDKATGALMFNECFVTLKKVGA